MEDFVVENRRCGMCLNRAQRAQREVKESKNMWRNKPPIYSSHSTRDWKKRKQELEQEENEQEFSRREKINKLVLPIF